MNLRIIGLVSLILLAVASIGAQTVIVTPSNATTQGWSTADTRPGGTVEITAFTDAHGGNGSLHFTTTDGSAKAQFMHGANVPLADITQLSYETFQQTANVPEGDASYQLPICLGGITSAGCVGFTTLVYEPYWNGAVINGAWQSWDVYSGQLWSSKTVNAGGSCSVMAGAGGPPLYSLADLKAACPDAVVVGFGVNVGSGNPGYNVYADYVNFNGTTYNFELYQTPTTADQCKNGGWMTLKRTGGMAGFKNQGDCIQYVNTGK